MITYRDILAFEAAEQERLQALPYAAPKKHFLDEYHGGKVVLQECGQDSPRGPRPDFRYNRETKRNYEVQVYTCQYVHCDMTWEEHELLTDTEGRGWDTSVPFITPPHAKVIPISEQNEQRMDLVCDLLGIGQNSDAGRRASLAVREARSAETEAGRFAVALPILLTALITQEVTKAAPTAVADLLSFHSELHDHPFFTEATLYELVGKDTARSILARTRNLAKATGYKERTG